MLLQLPQRAEAMLTCNYHLSAFWQTDSSVCNIRQRRTKNRYCSYLRSSFVFAGFACALQTLPQRSYLCRRPDYRSVESDRHRLRGSQALFCYLASLCSAKSSSIWVFALFMPPPAPVDIRDADHPGHYEIRIVREKDEVYDSPGNFTTVPFLANQERRRVVGLA